MRVETVGTDKKYYLYSADGIIGYVQDGQRYLYRKNLFGDITAIYQGTTKVAEYTYDAWGNCTIIQNTNGIGTRNPFRYRGYYYDTDLNLYYLLTRYYDPKTGRFINADSLEYLDPNKINGLNLYAYCRNNPIMHVDPNGCESESTYLNYYLFHALIALILGLGLIFADEFPKGKNPFDDFESNIDFEVLEPFEGSYWNGPDWSSGRIFEGELVFLKGYIHLDENKNHSLYISLLNLSVFLGLNGKNIGGEIEGSLIDFGYEGMYFDASFPMFGMGISVNFKNGSLELGFDPPSTIGIDITIHFDRIFSEILGE